MYLWDGNDNDRFNVPILSEKATANGKTWKLTIHNSQFVLMIQQTSKEIQREYKTQMLHNSDIYAKT